MTGAGDCYAGTRSAWPSSRSAERGPDTRRDQGSGRPDLLDDLELQQARAGGDRLAALPRRPVPACAARAGPAAHAWYASSVSHRV